MTTISRENIKAVIESAGSTFFTVEFVKADGSIRKMNCRKGVSKHLRGGDSTLTGKPHLVTVFDMQKKAYRAINLDTVRWVRVRGQRHIFRL